MVDSVEVVEQITDVFKLKIFIKVKTLLCDLMLYRQF